MGMKTAEPLSWAKISCRVVIGTAQFFIPPDAGVDAQKLGQALLQIEVEARDPTGVRQSARTEVVLVCVTDEDVVVEARQIGHRPALTLSKSTIVPGRSRGCKRPRGLRSGPGRRAGSTSGPEARP